MTHLEAVLLAHLHRVDVIPSLCDEDEYRAQDNLADVWEEMVKVAKVNDQMIKVSAGEIVKAHVLISRRHHHLRPCHKKPLCFFLSSFISESSEFVFFSLLISGRFLQYVFVVPD